MTAGQMKAICNKHADVLHDSISDMERHHKDYRFLGKPHCEGDAGRSLLQAIEFMREAETKFNSAAMSLDQAQYFGALCK